MGTLVWASLGFFLLVFVAVLAAAAVLGLRGWRRLRALRGGLLGGLEELSGGVSLLERRAARLADRAEELQRATARLNRSVAGLKLLLEEVRAARAALATGFGLFPRG